MVSLIEEHAGRTPMRVEKAASWSRRAVAGTALAAAAVAARKAWQARYA
jgi:hypothetical protein